MHRRLVIATIAVALLATTAGCSTILGGISDEELDREAEYDELRDSETDVTIAVQDGEFKAVYDLNNTEELSLYRSTFYRDEAMDVWAVRYWYPNGTERTGSELDVDQSRSATTVTVPDGNGTLAFSGPAGSKTFRLPAFVTGSYQVWLPEDHRTTNFLFGNVRPGDYDREVVDNHEHLTWESVDSTISIRFYLTRDIPLFAGVVLIVTILGGIGIAYYYRQVKKLRERREEMGLDVEMDDDSDSGPPPGFR